MPTQKTDDVGDGTMPDTEQTVIQPMQQHSIPHQQPPGMASQQSLSVVEPVVRQGGHAHQDAQPADQGAAGQQHADERDSTSAAARSTADVPASAVHADTDAGVLGLDSATQLSPPCQAEADGLRQQPTAGHDSAKGHAMPSRLSPARAALRPVQAGFSTAAGKPLSVDADKMAAVQRQWAAAEAAAETSAASGFAAFSTAGGKPVPITADSMLAAQALLAGDEAPESHPAAGTSAAHQGSFAGFSTAGGRSVVVRAESVQAAERLLGASAEAEESAVTVPAPPTASFARLQHCSWQVSGYFSRQAASC